MFFAQKVRASAYEESPLSAFKEFLLVRKMSALDNPLLTANVFYGQPLTKKFSLLNDYSKIIPVLIKLTIENFLRNFCSSVKHL